MEAKFMIWFIIGFIIYLVIKAYFAFSQRDMPSYSTATPVAEESIDGIFDDILSLELKKYDVLAGSPENAKRVLDRNLSAVFIVDTYTYFRSKLEGTEWVIPESKLAKPIFRDFSIEFRTSLVGDQNVLALPLLYDASSSPLDMAKQFGLSHGFNSKRSKQAEYTC